MEKPTCMRCKFGQWEWQDYGVPGLYYCKLANDWISEKDANNEELPCEGFVPDDQYSNDDTTTQS